jgi:hypothetical protein
MGIRISDSILDPTLVTSCGHFVEPYVPFRVLGHRRERSWRLESYERAPAKHGRQFPEVLWDLLLRSRVDTRTVSPDGYGNPTHHDLGTSLWDRPALPGTGLHLSSWTGIERHGVVRTPSRSALQSALVKVSRLSCRCSVASKRATNSVLQLPLTGWPSDLSRSCKAPNLSSATLTGIASSGLCVQSSQVFRPGVGGWVRPPICCPIV